MGSVVKKYLSETHPELAKEWHPTKNGDLTPEMVTYGSCKKVWWFCEKGHEWESTVSNRTFNKNGCPHCFVTERMGGLTDYIINQTPAARLSEKNPDLAEQWHPTKNGDLTPSSVKANSRQKVWWVCESGHEWQTSVRSRVHSGSGCPYCSRKGPKPKTDDNSLQTKRPDIAQWWHPTLNRDLTPNDITVGSNKKVWWTCENKHAWEASVLNRTHTPGTGCPFCSGQKVLKGFNDLATVNPEVAKKWHPTKNGDLTPEMVTAKSNRYVWWICENGHELRGKIGNATTRLNCPICINQQVLVGYNDLLSQRPDIAQDWNPDKNDELTPEMVTYCSNTKVWWKCKNGHETATTVRARFKTGGCAYCLGKRVYEKLASTHPEIAKEWHPTKNEPLVLDQISSGSNRKVWWKCENGHEWQSSVDQRTYYKTKCPFCKKEKRTEEN